MSKKSKATDLSEFYKIEKKNRIIDKKAVDSIIILNNI